MGMERIKVFIADDHTLFVQGLISLLESESYIELLGWVEDGQKALEMSLRLHPDILILDISMPKLNGLQVARRLKENSQVEIILLTVHKEMHYLKEAMNLDVKGYVLKEDAFEDLICAIKDVSEGKQYISPALKKSVEALMKLDYLSFQSCLTKREEEVLDLIAEGLTNKQIASELKISRRTVESHRANIMRKFNLKTSAQLIKFALKKRWK